MFHKCHKLLLSFGLVFGIMLLNGSAVYGQGSPNITLLDHLDDYTSYNDCWGYTAPDNREYALLGVVNGTSIIDITTSGDAAEIEFISSNSSSWKDIKTYQSYAYVVNESGGGMQIIDLSDLPNSATLVGTYNGFSTSHNIYIDEPNAMLYAEGTGGSAVRAISLAEPLNPVQLSTFGIECHDIYARDNIVYISEGGSGSIGIYDLSNPSSPTFISRFQIPSSGYVHNAWLSDDGNYLMTTEETTGKTVKLWNVEDFNNVFLVDEYLAPSNLAHNTHLKGNYAYISHYADGLRIVDISNPVNIFEAGFYDTSPNTGGFNGAWGAFPFFPSGKVLISDIQSGLYVFNFDDGSPSVVSVSLTPTNPPINIPPQGGQFGYTISLTNNTASSQNIDIWNIIVTPSGEAIGPIIGPVNADLEAGSMITKNLSQSVPSQAPPGQYTYVFNVGDYPNRVIATDELVFTKSSSGPLAKMPVSGELANWILLNAETDEPLNESDWFALTSSPESDIVPKEFILGQNYPNPFNPSTTIEYQLLQSDRVRITIYDLRGRRVRQLVNDYQNAGHHRIQWDGKDQSGQIVANGTYIYQLQTSEVQQTRKMVLLK